ncbi:unnamed protein product [Didymodactylos carnosus]|uniref:Uncharacterized protein n=2 Tax=Didymodactylos carnosus TaxID=1234261 RepID=A0A813THB1_9BILA|nr:unnamed protein product [Didymodactylos carnosus]CAF3593766.1 unnamed protein product [Didymodactylos carnosus]
MLNEMNTVRENEIMTKIIQCDKSSTLRDLCIHYHYNFQNRKLEYDVLEFQSLGLVPQALVGERIVEQIKRTCLYGEWWCLAHNVSNDRDLLFTIDILRKQGTSFCTIEQCRPRIKQYIDKCDQLSENISITMSIMPLLCTIHQQNIASQDCFEEIAKLLHVVYASWRQIQITKTCTSMSPRIGIDEAAPLPDCHEQTSVTALSWYTNTNTDELCDSTFQNTSKSIIESHISYDALYHFLQQKPVYIGLVVILIASFISLIVLLLYCINKTGSESLHIRRPGDSYDYSRLQNPSFEPNNAFEETSLNSTMPDTAHGQRSEYQRLLNVET